MRFYCSKISLIALVFLVAVFIKFTNNKFKIDYCVKVCIEDYKGVKFDFVLPLNYPRLFNYKQDTIRFGEVNDETVLDSCFVLMRSDSLISFCFDFSNANYSDFIRLIDNCKNRQIDRMVLLDNCIFVYNDRIAMEQIHKNTLFINCTNVLVDEKISDK